jgi:hypothetical protein
LRVRFADSLSEQALFPADNRVILEREQDHDDGREPDKLSADGKTGPQEDVADVQGIADQREGPARHQRTEAVAPRPRDRADVVHRPEPDGFADRNDQRAHDPQ